MKKSIRILLLSIGFALTLWGGFWIGAVCSYSTSAGPMNLDASFIFSIAGVVFFILGSIILKRQLKRNHNFLRLYFFFMSILIFSFGIFVLKDSKKSAEQRCSNSEAIGVMAPNGINLSIFCFTCIGLFFYGLVGKEDKKPYKYLDHPKYD